VRVLLVEPWLDGSHRQWAHGYRDHSSHRVSVVGLAGAGWRWRLRGGALELARLVVEWVAENGAPDVLVVSGMVDVAQLVGFTRRSINPTIPVLVYQHESQLLYPTPDGNPNSEAVLHNWMSWCVADRVVFNSDYHRSQVERQLPVYLAGLPDNTHLDRVDEVMARFDVLAVGVETEKLVDHVRHGAAVANPGRPVVLWPHRWEADKEPRAFANALGKLRANGRDFGLVLAGEDPQASSEAGAIRSQVADEFEQHVVAVGPFGREDYVGWLKQADIVVSCARQEMFGIGVVEAMGAGCIPVLPNDLAYPELIPRHLRPQCLYPPGRFATALMNCIDNYETLAEMKLTLAESMVQFDWSRVAPRYDLYIEELGQ